MILPRYAVMESQARKCPELGVPDIKKAIRIDIII